MTTKGIVYVIDDDEAMRDSLNFLLESSGFGVTLSRKPFSMPCPASPSAASSPTCACPG